MNRSMEHLIEGPIEAFDEQKFKPIASTKLNNDRVNARASRSNACSVPGIMSV